MMGGGIVGQDQMALSTRQESVEEGLERRKKHLEDLLADVNLALSALKSQPQLLDTLNVLRRVGI